jgi:uncharacterized protein (TIGR02001 family)
VTATLVLRRTIGRRGTSRAFGGASLALALSCIFPSPARAQWGGTLSLESDYRLRGYSLTDGDPAGIGQLTYDDPSGMYVNLAGVARLRGENPQFMGVIGNIGYARRLSSVVTLDAGVLRSQLRASHDFVRPYRYTEFYAGASVGPVVGRVYYSPDYRGGTGSTVYGELETGFEPAPEWTISAHVGLLAHLDATSYQGTKSAHEDWRISVSKRFGRLEIHSILSGGGPGEQYLGYRKSHKAALTAGASVSF